ncbi:MAG: hypothetical protein WCD18_01130 [Thermosynechococcaceae cyanobacterium]
MTNFKGLPRSLEDSITGSLSFEERYPCPVCRYGQLEGLFMMEAFACSFCRHIFTTDLAQQCIRLEDNVQPLQWRWRRDRWVALREISTDWLLVIWAVGVAFVSIPTALVWLVYHTFPPLPGQNGAMFPLVWTGLVFVAHFAIVGWLWVEHFQYPLYVTAKLYCQRFFAQLLGTS